MMVPYIYHHTIDIIDVDGEIEIKQKLFTKKISESEAVGG